MLKNIITKIPLPDFKWSYLLKGVIVLVILASLFWGYKIVNKPPIVPEEVLNDGLKATINAQSFRFSLEYKTKTEKKENILSKVKGEKVGVDKIHIVGEMVKTPVEIFQLKDQTYIKNSLGTWMVLDENDIHQQELLVNEVNPLSVFAFKEIPEVKYKGAKDFKGKEHYIIEYLPNIANQYLEILGTDFVFTSWIDPETKFISKTTVIAKSKSKEKENILINLEFYDYDADIIINPPEVTEKPQ